MDVPEIEKTKHSLDTITREGAEGSEHLLLYLAAALVVGGIYLFPKGWWITATMVAVAIVICVIVILIRKAPLVDLSILKGASPFGTEEGELLSGFGREAELTDLRNQVTGEQVAVIFLWGHSAVGKTSIATAALENSLAKSTRENKREFLYVDASQPDFEENFVAENRPSSTDKENPPKNVREIILSERLRRQVVVIDNASQSSNPGKLVDWITLALIKGPPYKRIFIIIFDERNFRDAWGNREWPRSKSALRKPRIKRFTVAEAKTVAIALKKRAGVKISDKLIDEIIGDIASMPGAEVSPLSLSILVKLVGTASVQGFDIKDYRAAGYAAGLMGRYIRDHLRDHAPDNWADIIVALARQVSSGAHEFRKDALGLPQMSATDLASLFETLSSPEVRILRANHDQTVFKILDDWLPALEAFRDFPNPEVAFLEQHIARKYRWWSDGRIFSVSKLWRLLSEGRYLLTRSDLRQIRKNRKTLRLGGDVHLLKYVARSRHYRVAQLVVGVIAILSLVPASMSAYWLAQRWQARNVEEGWGLPSDFGRYGDQFKELSVVCMVNNLRWLPRGLESLDAHCERIKSLEGVPPHLKHLGLSLTKVRNLDGLPSSVVDLNISGTDISGIEGLGSGIFEMLDISGIRAQNMKLIPRSVTSLKLHYQDIDNLEGLPEKLAYLEIRGTAIRSLRGLPNNIRHLTLAGNGLLEMDSLPTHLESLETDIFPGTATMPSSLKHLILSNLSSVRVPEGVTEVELKKSSIVGDFAKEIGLLKVHDATFSPSLEKLPENLHHLKLHWPKGASFALLPNHLVELDLKGSENLTSIAGIGPLTDLDISGTAIRDLRDVPESVTTLRFESCAANGLTAFPKHLVKLYLGDCNKLELIENIPPSVTELYIYKTSVSTIANLPAGLLKLDISNTEITILPKLPSHLEELTLHAGQIEALKGLPKSVTRIRFVEPERDK
jgi:hypothetical protein